MKSYSLSLWFKKLLCCLSVKLTVTECFLNLHVDKARPCKVAMAHSLYMMWPAICEAMTTSPSPSQNPLSRCYLANRSVHAPQQGSIDCYCLKAPCSSHDMSPSCPKCMWLSGMQGATTRSNSFSSIKV